MLVPSAVRGAPGETVDEQIEQQLEACVGVVYGEVVGQLEQVGKALARELGEVIAGHGCRILPGGRRLVRFEANGHVGREAVDVAHHLLSGTDPWPLVPGLIVSCAGLALLIIPLANVMLAAVPADAARGASGIFTPRSSSAARLA
ncbi:MAG: hypothetical protein WBP81_38760 [Solirubrobacteraceae bacterium]